jgi:hypothetical protein
MSEAVATSRAKNLVLTSPYFLLIFLFVPAVTIVSFLLHLPFKMDLLLYNNIALLLCVALRFAWYLSRVKRSDRYGAECGEPKGVVDLAQGAGDVRSELAERGYSFDAAGLYGEKPDLGYLGTLLLYGGLALLLLFGSYDNLWQFSGVVRLGIGDPAAINKPQSYGELIMGPAASLERLPRLQVRKLILPNKEWPKGAIELGLWTKEGRMLTSGLTTLGKSLRYGGFEYDMLKFSDVANLKVVDRANQVVFDGVLTMLPLPRKKGGYTHYTQVDDPNFERVKGEAWFNPEKKSMKLVLQQDGKQVLDTEMDLWGKNLIKQGEYTASFPRLGQFAEIRVAHVRHFVMLKIGAVIALLGGLIRLLFRPQRVWLRENGAGCRVKAAGSAARKLLEGLAAR